jgi:hypothetical protein
VTHGHVGGLPTLKQITQRIRLGGVIDDSFQIEPIFLKWKDICKTIYEIQVHGKKWKVCAKQKRYEGVSKALDMLGACNMSHVFTN